MAIGFRELIFHLQSPGPEVSQSQTVLFGGTVTFASAAIKAFDVVFDNGDHNILQEIVRVNTSTTGPHRPGRSDLAPTRQRHKQSLPWRDQGPRRSGACLTEIGLYQGSCRHRS